jgi:hypothetical protein
VVQAGGFGAVTRAVEGFGGCAKQYEPQIEKVSAHHGNLVFTALAEELRTGDVAVVGSAAVAGYPENEGLVIDPETGIPSLKAFRAGGQRPSAKRLELEIKARMPERSLMGIVARTAYWVEWWRRHEASRHIPGVSGHELSYVADKHFSIVLPNEAVADPVNAHARLDISQAWGDGTAVAADGTHMDTYLDDLLSETGVRDGKPGGSAWNPRLLRVARGAAGRRTNRVNIERQVRRSTVRATAAWPPTRTGCSRWVVSMAAVMVDGLPRRSPMSTVRRSVPNRAMCAARQAVLLALAMSSGTPIDGANIRAAARPCRSGIE